MACSRELPPRAAANDNAAPRAEGFLGAAARHAGRRHAFMRTPEEKRFVAEEGRLAAALHRKHLPGGTPMDGGGA